MSNARLFSTIALTAVISAALVAGLTLPRSAKAQVGRPAVCTIQSGMGLKASTVAEWMNAEVAAGYGNFSQTSLYAGGLLLCAW
jgi:hypothetical protein